VINYDQAVLWPATEDEVQIILSAKTEILSPFLKWAGGKDQESRHILPLIPSFVNYYEPFIGGGAVFFSLRPQKSFLNDKSEELFNLYIMIAQNDESFFEALDILLSGWQQVSRIVDSDVASLINIYKMYSTSAYTDEEMQRKLFEFLERHLIEFKLMFEILFSKHVENFIHELRRNLLSKTKRMKTLESKKWKLPDYDIIANIECALKSAYYMHLRYLYNNIHRYEIPPSCAAALFFFVRENAYASMFRYNARGEFNVPYGGLSYNRKDLARKIAYMRSSELQRQLNNAVIENMDFEVFLLKYPPQEHDFIFLDPPYDSEFSTYALNEFSMKDQERLANYLKTQCKAKFMLVIKNTPAIYKLYDQTNLTVRAFDKKYQVSFQDRNDRNVEHLMITNY
jgi:DNA adenine methylase